jgi:hypothetical protein
MKMTLFRGFMMGAVLIGMMAVGPDRLAAQATNSTSATQLPQPMLDHDEMTQLNKARTTVFASHPDLKAENEKLKAMHDSPTTPTEEQRAKTFAEWKDYQKQMRAEMLTVDPTLKPIFAKIDAARRNGSPTPFPPAK